MNSVMKNAMVNTRNWDSGNDPEWIKCEREELEQLKALFEPAVQERIVDHVHEQMEAGVTFAFWLDDNGYLYCEG